MTFIYKPVEKIPDRLDADTVYHTETFGLAALLCACGCGHKVMLIVPESHQVTSNAGRATVRPSIAVCDGPCRSHYFITAGKTEWLPAFSAGQASSLMQRQIARHTEYDRPKSFLSRIWTTVLSLIHRLFGSPG